MADPIVPGESTLLTVITNAARAAESVKRWSPRDQGQDFSENESERGNDRKRIMKP